MIVKMIWSRCSHTAMTHCLGEAAAANEEVLFSHDVSSWKSGLMQILPNQDTLSPNHSEKHHSVVLLANFSLFEKILLWFCCKSLFLSWLQFLAITLNYFFFLTYVTGQLALCSNRALCRDLRLCSDVMRGLSNKNSAVGKYGQTHIRPFSNQCALWH